ncbi:MAG: hypothetical protein HYY30_00180 [Chloroflexi bacterium]|nr:hypothetical protein [Chloroflexota bacterium]
MNTAVTPELLATCLAQIDSGESSIEDCVAAHPAVAGELRRLLEVAGAIAPLPPATLDPSFRLRGRVALIGAIDADRNAAPKSLFHRFWGRMSNGWERSSPLLPRRIEMPARIAALVIALTTAAGGGAVYASQDALPGEALYQVKTTVEGLQLTLAADDEAKAQTYLDLAATRLAEIHKASQIGNATAIGMAAEALAEDITRIDRHLTQAATSGRDVSLLANRFADNLARQQTALAAVEERVPEQAKAAVAKAAEQAKRSERGLTSADSGVRRKPKAGGATDATPVPTPTAMAGGQRASTVGLATPTVIPTATLSNTDSVTLTRMISDVASLAIDAAVPGQSHNGLLAKLQSAEAALQKGQQGIAANTLAAFLHELDALYRSGHIDTDNYNALFADHSALIDSLDGKGKEKPGTGRPAGKNKNDEATATPEPTERSDSDFAPTAGPRRSGPGERSGRAERRSATSPTSEPDATELTTPPSATPVPSAKPVPRAGSSSRGNSAPHAVATPPKGKR